MVMGDAAKALKLATGLRRLINVEYKTINITIGDTTPTTTGVIQNLTAIAQGDDSGSRDGRKIRLASIKIQGSIKQHETATQTTTRMVLVIDHDNTGTPPTIAELFLTQAVFNTGQAKLGEPVPNSRFTVLLDKTFAMSDSGQKLFLLNYYRKLNHHVVFGGVGATDEGKGSLWLMTGSSEATNTPTLSMTSTTKWIDN